MTPEQHAEFILAKYPDHVLAQAYLDLLKKWDGLDDPSEEMVREALTQFEGISVYEIRTIYEVMIKEAKK